MASLGGTVLERITSEISRFKGMSSRLEDVARSICSSSALAADEPNQLAMAGATCGIGVVRACGSCYRVLQREMRARRWG